MLIEQTGQDPVHLGLQRRDGAPLVENLRRIAERDEELTPLSVRINSSTRYRLERLIGHLPKRKRAEVLRALLEHAISAAELQGFPGPPPE